MQSNGSPSSGHLDALVGIEVMERAVRLQEECKDRQLARRVLVAKIVIALILAVAAIVMGALGMPVAAGSAGSASVAASVDSGVGLWRISRSRSP